MVDGKHLDKLVRMILWRQYLMPLSSKWSHHGFAFTLQLHHPEKHALMTDIPTYKSYVYFVHSYHARLVPDENVIAITDYDYLFPTIIGKGYTFGVQFHPEKSQAAGQQLLKNFCEMRV